MKTLYRRTVSSTNATRLFSVLILASLLFSVLPALSTPGAVAQDGEVTTPTADVQESAEAQENGEPTPTPDGQQSGQTDAAQEVQEGGVAAFIAEARTCPPGFDPSAGDASAALASCVEPLAGVAFTLGTQNPNYPGDTRTTGGDGFAVWSDIPLGTGYSVAESVPQGSGDPWVYCEVTGGPGGDQYFFFPTTGGFMDVGLSDPNLANYAQTYCRWFNVPLADPTLALTPAGAAAGAGEVHLTNYRCPVNYNTADMTLPALKAACTTLGEGFQFTLKASQGGPRTDTTNAQGGLIWTDVPSGNLTIAESIPDGIQFAQPYCSVAPVGSPPGSPDLSLVKSDGKTISGQLSPSQALHCELFNIPEPESTVAVIPWLCPSDYNTADMTLYALTRGCSIPGTDIEYTLTSAEGEQLTGTTGTTGFVEWKNLPSGTVAFEESVPPGYWFGAVYCDPAPPQGELDGISWQTPKVQDNVVSYDIPDRYTLNCYVFHIWIEPPPVPTDAGAYVVNLTSYLCPPEATFDDLASVANNSSLCHGTPGWTYEHDGEGFSQEVMTDPVGATAVGHSPAGPFTLTQNTQEGSRPVALWCSSNGGAFRNLLYSDEYVFTYTPTAGEVLNCQWFNVSLYPEGTYVTITIEKYLCGPDFPETVVVEDWRTACPDPHPGVTFNAEQSGVEIATETTGDDGIVSFQVLPGDVDIQPASPDALGNGYAWCGAGAEGATPTYVNAGRLSPGETGMPLSNVNPSLVYSCDWFTVPLEDTPKMAEDSGNVVVLKWRCPAGFDAAGATLEQLRATCPTPQPGVTIGVSYASGDSFTGQTRLEKGPAIARIEGLPPGKVGIGEPGPNGHELQRVFCSTGDVGQPGLTVTDGNVEYTVSDGGIAATIEAGKEIECQFFNVPVDTQGEPPTAGTVFVDKRSCPPGFAAINSSYTDIAMYCAAEASVEFTVTQGETVLSAVTGETGVAKFPKVSAGAVRISEYPREGYDPPRVFCRATAETEGAIGELAPVPVDNWGIAYDLRAGDYLECVWANMPAATTSTDPGTIILHKYTCPEGTGEYESLQELFASCTGRPEGVKFTVGQPLSTPIEGVTGPGGDVTFTNVAPGFNLIDEPAGQGYDPIASWCGYYPSATGSARDYGMHSVSPQSAYMAGGYTLECYWFNVPYVEPAILDITMRICPAAINLVDLTNDKILSDCAAIPAGVQVRVQSASSPESIDVTKTTNEEGKVSFEDIPAMPLRISELSPFYQTVHVNCGHAEKGQSPTSYTSLAITDEGIAYQAEPNTVITCYWVTIEAPLVKVYVFKHVCPADYDYEHAAQLDLNGACVPIDGVEFQVRNDAAAYQYTLPVDPSGLALFKGVPPGPLLISELTPGYLPVRVFCGHVPSDSTTEPTEYRDLEIANGTVEYLAEPDTIIACYWFNIETKYAKAAVHKFGCHEGYVPQGRTYEDVLVECPTPLEGVTFTLGAPAAELSQDTDTSGTVVWEDLAPGPLFISETPSDGYSAAIVFCAGFPEGTPATKFEQVPVEQLAIEREVAAGETLACFWFNYSHPSDPNQPSPTPIPVSTPVPGINTPTPSPTPDPDAPATLILTTFICPAGYDVYEAGSDPVEDCAEATPGIEVSIADLDEVTTPVAPADVATTDEDGMVTFSALEPGPWLLTESLPETTLTAFIASCTSDQRDLQEAPLFTPLTYLGPEGQIGIVLVAGETLACDSYAIPEDTAAE